MATVVRVKRRRDEDPLEILELAFKKQKSATQKKDQNVSIEKTSFKFAGTVNSKDAKVSKHVREAIRKDKLEKEYKQHQINILGEVRELSRQATRQKSIQNRFKVKANYRALELDSLDAATKKRDAPTSQSTQKETKKDSVCALCGKTLRPGQDIVQCGCDSDKQENSGSSSKSGSSTKSVDNSLLPDTLLEGVTNDSLTGTVTECDIDSNASLTGSSETTEGVSGQSQVDVKKQRDVSEDDGCRFCLVDMEADVETAYKTAIESCSSQQIVCNAERMVRQVVEPASNDADYVYDLYYTNNRDFDFRMFESNLMLEACSEDLWMGRGSCDDDFVDEDDDDDENAECNWRNDYPEKDPGFIENQDLDYEYGEGLEEYTSFGAPDQLSEWMTWKCNVEGEDLLSSDDDAVDRYENAGQSYEAYYRRVHKEIGDMEGTGIVESETVFERR